MDFVVTTLIPYNKSFEFTHFLPKPIEFKQDEEWLVGVTEFVHSEIYGSEYTLSIDAIVFKKVDVKNELNLNKFAKHILVHSKNPLVYGLDYLSNFIQQKLELVDYVDKHYVAVKQEAGEILKIKSEGFIADKDLQAVFNKALKPPTYDFYYDREYTLHEIFLTIMAQTLAYIRELDKVKEAQKELTNLLKLFIMGFRAEKAAYLAKNQIPSHDLFITIRCDCVAPSLIGDMYENFLYFGPSKPREIQRVNYFKVIKNYINQIKFSMSDLHNSRLVFNESGYPFIYIKLHFKKEEIKN